MWLTLRSLDLFTPKKITSEWIDLNQPDNLVSQISTSQVHCQARREDEGAGTVV